MEITTLKTILLTHKKRFLNKSDLIKREVLENIEKQIDPREIVFISGIRRSGKSSLMFLISQYLLETKKINEENIFFVNFEDERFINFTVEDFEKLYQSYLELENPKGKKYLFFDEIQNIAGWERWINRLYEFEDVKIFITGSNASLNSSSISTSLTGRNRQIYLYPFSFKEYLLLEGKSLNDRNLYLTENIAEIKRLFTNYINLGGFPEVLKNKDINIADQYFKDIIYRDVISNYKLRNLKEIKELCLYLITNSGSLLSYESLRKTIDAKNATTIKNYLNILEDVFLIYPLAKFDFSVKKQIYNASKYYVADLGFYHAVGFKFSDNMGKILENIVFEKLLRNGKEFFYWKSKDGNEVDFVIKEKTKLLEAIQITYSLTKENREREIRSLFSIIEELGALNCIILTFEQQETIETDFGKIEVIPIWKWLLT